MAQNGAHYAALRRQADAEFDAGQYYAAAGTYQAALALAPPQEHEEAKGTAGNSCDFQLEEALRLQQAMVLEPPADEAQAEAQLAEAIALSEAVGVEDDMLEQALAQTLAEAAAAAAEFAQAQRASREEAEALARRHVDDIARAEAASRLQLDKDAAAKAAADAKDNDELAMAKVASLAKSTKAAEKRVAESAASAAAMDNGYCPICFDDPVDPVTTCDGFGPYCKVCITAWMTKSSTSPMTGEPLENKELTPVIVEAKVQPAVGGSRSKAVRMEAVSDSGDEPGFADSVRSTVALGLDSVALTALRISTAVNGASIPKKVSSKLLSVSANLTTRYCKGCKSVFDGNVCAREPPHPNFLYTKTIPEAAFDADFDAVSDSDSDAAPPPAASAADVDLSEASPSDFAAVSDSDGDATPPAAAPAADVDTSTELAGWIDPCKVAEIQANHAEKHLSLAYHAEKHLPLAKANQVLLKASMQGFKDVKAKGKENQRLRQTLDVQKRLNRKQQHLIQCIQDERVETQRQREEADARRARELKDEDPPRKCKVCYDAFRRSHGIDCPSAGGDHFVCSECFDGFIESQSRDDIDLLKARAGRVFCCGGCPGSNNGGAGSTAFTDKQVFAVCSDAAGAKFIETKAIVVEAKVAADVQADSDAKYEAKVEQLVQMTLEEQQTELSVTKERKAIEEALKGPECPACHQVFVDFTGCAALTCGNCSKHFCAWCQLDCNADAHAHAAVCTHRPAPFQGSDATPAAVMGVFFKRVGKPMATAMIEGGNVAATGKAYPGLDPAIRKRVVLLLRTLLELPESADPAQFNVNVHGVGLADLFEKYQ